MFNKRYERKETEAILRELYIHVTSSVTRQTKYYVKTDTSKYTYSHTERTPNTQTTEREREHNKGETTLVYILLESTCERGKVQKTNASKATTIVAAEQRKNYCSSELK